MSYHHKATGILHWHRRRDMVHEMSGTVEVLVCPILLWLIICGGSKSENTIAGFKFIGSVGSCFDHNSREIVSSNTVGESELRVSKISRVDSGKLHLNEDLIGEGLVDTVDVANVWLAILVGENCEGGGLHRRCGCKERGVLGEDSVGNLIICMSCGNTDEGLLIR